MASSDNGKARDGDSQNECTGGKAGAPGNDVKKVMAHKVISQSGDSAVIQFLYAGPPRMNPQTRQMMTPKPPEPVEMVRVSGKWLPKKMVNDWKDGVESAKSQLDLAMPQVSAALAGVIPFASSLANAKTQQEFNTVLQPIATMIQSAIAAGGGNGMAGGMGPMGSSGSMGPMGSSGGSSEQPAGSSGGNSGPGRPSMSSQ